MGGRDVVDVVEPKKDTKNKDEQTQLVSDVRRILATPEGKRFFVWFFQTFPLLRECYTKNADTYYFLGQWSVSRTINNLLADAVPDLMVPLLLREEFDSERTD